MKMAADNQIFERNISTSDPSTDMHVIEWRRFVLVLISLDLVKQIFNDKTFKVQYFRFFFYFMQIYSMYNIRQKTKKKTEVKRQHYQLGAVKI